MIEIKININDEEKRLDNFIAKCYPNLMKVLIYKYIRTKKIKVNDKKVDIDYRLQNGDIIKIFINENNLNNKNTLQKYESNLAFLNASDNIEIIYENKDLMIVNKPIGLLVHSSKKDENNTLIDQVKKYLYKQNEYNPEIENTFSPALSNRLDRNTSGLVIVSKNYKTLKRINEAIENKEISKYYYTYVYGKFENKSGMLKNFILKDEVKNIAITFDKKMTNAKIALLKYRVIAYYPKDNISMLQIELLTGRFHQIRAQLSYINHPLVGDGKYFDPKKHDYKRINQKYQILIAYKLLFNDKLSGFLFHINDNMAFEIPDIYKNLKTMYKFN